jgi:hypothetical protein
MLLLLDFYGLKPSLAKKWLAHRCFQSKFQCLWHEEETSSFTPPDQSSHNYVLGHLTAMSL